MRSWTGPALALALLASGGATAQQTREPLTPEDARPPADLLTSCEGDNAPPALPDALSGWATIYCTKQGHMFSPNDRHVGTFPGSGQRGVLYAAMLDGATAPGPNDSRFAKVTYDPLSEDDIRKVSEGATGAMGTILAGHRHRGPAVLGRPSQGRKALGRGLLRDDPGPVERQGEGSGQALTAGNGKPRRESTGVFTSSTGIDTGLGEGLEPPTPGSRRCSTAEATLKARVSRRGLCARPTDPTPSALAPLRAPERRS
jgi:hypothetical protein